MRVKMLVLLAVMLFAAACGPSVETTIPTNPPPPTATHTPIPEATEPPVETDVPAATATAAMEAPPTAGIDGQALLQDRCTGCHSLTRVETASKTAEAWEATVNRMIGYGVVLSAEELEVLVQYLAETYP
jgi:cytochrome c5